MIYKWKPGARINIPAQQVGERLEELQHQHGHLTPEIVVEDARDETSVLHPAFEWDDARAAHEHRLNQARHLLRSLVIVREDVPLEQEKTVRAFVVVQGGDAEQPAERPTVYMPTLTVLRDPDLRKQVLAQALRELEAFKRKYQELRELAEVLAAVDRVLIAHRCLTV